MFSVSVRFNGVRVRVIKLGIVPCKLLIAQGSILGKISGNPDGLPR